MHLFLTGGTSTRKFAQPLKHVATGGHMTDYISTITMPVVTKPVRMVSYCEDLPPKNSNDSSIRWSWEVKWQIKYIISPTVEDPRISN